jgi:hypothetical protein
MPSKLTYVAGKIKKNPKLAMEYVWYEVDIREALGVELAGWPDDVKMQRPAQWNTETACRILGMLHTGAMHWVHMTKTQHKVLIEDHNKRRALSGDGALKRRAVRSDLGTKRAKKADKTSGGKKSKQQRGETSEDEDEDGDGDDDDEDEDEDKGSDDEEEEDEDKRSDDEEEEEERAREEEEDEERDKELEAGEVPASRNDTPVVPTERAANSALAPGAGSAIFDAFGQSLRMPSPVLSGADASHGPVLDESLAFRPLAFPTFDPDADFNFDWTLQLDMHATMPAHPFTYAPTYGPTPNVPWLQLPGASSEESGLAAPSAAVLNTTNLNAAGPLNDCPTAPVAKRKRTAAKDAADAPAAKKARKAAKKKAAGGENAPPAAEGSAPSKKPRKTRSDKGSKRRK